MSSSNVQPQRIYDRECIICLEQVCKPNVCQRIFSPSNKEKILHCGHVFHEACVRQWLDEHHTCPTCRVRQVEVLKENNPAIGIRQVEAVVDHRPYYANHHQHYGYRSLYHNVSWDKLVMLLIPSVVLLGLLYFMLTILHALYIYRR